MPTHSSFSAPAASRQRRPSAVLSLYLLLIVVGLCISPSAAGKKRVREKCAAELGLIKSGISAEDVIAQHKLFCNASRVNFANEVLGFVTPWNEGGFKTSYYFRRKLTYVSPVWLRVIERGEGTGEGQQVSGDFQFAGLDVIDSDWVEVISEPTDSNTRTLVVPRIAVEDFRNSSKLESFLTQPQVFVDFVSQLCSDRGFHGVVIEGIILMVEGVKQTAKSWLKSVGEGLQHQGLIAMFVLPPFNRLDDVDLRVPFTFDDMRDLSSSIHRFVLMTYDHTLGRTPGPSAPIQWLERIVSGLLTPKDPSTPPNAASQLLMGLPFYGRTWDLSESRKAVASSILGQEIVTLLKSAPATLHWDDQAKEHHADVQVSDGTVRIYFPTLKFLEERLELARRVGVGVSIWELGQGHDYFWDLL
ncbi:unnamed protein product [Vitrella brassicaformis CCMP3155]|uniref:Chitinase domain-containing protein 1 n=2 Tax=Vitrella brassicaformis TaxID=1169539 RepID=A0A0G4EJ42_VITBC|nr:unnamed protein product [Vitrella brassicaformis CCMP3155]|eukprot:CEL97031.1 unnamed protein product [Vitrella brassicaformis CCMP3155]